MEYIDVKVALSFYKRKCDRLREELEMFISDKAKLTVNLDVALKRIEVLENEVVRLSDLVGGADRHLANRILEGEV